MDEMRQMGKKYIDEKLAKARRTYIEDMINQKEDKPFPSIPLYPLSG